VTLYKSKYRIESTRLEEYDYSSPGEYFVTICARGYKCFFGEIDREEMHLNESGIIARNIWENIAQKHLNVQLDEFIIMPNHIHGIIILYKNNHCRDAINRVSTGGITKKT